MKPNFKTANRKQNYVKVEAGIQQEKQTAEVKYITYLQTVAGTPPRRRRERHAAVERKMTGGTCFSDRSKMIVKANSNRNCGGRSARRNRKKWSLKSDFKLVLNGSRIREPLTTNRTAA